MKFVKKFRRVISILFLLITVGSVVQPNIAYALTTGQHQPEYTSYEQPGATDVVNLLTGDFCYSIPLLEVPGPDGGFSVPLTYNAGIGVEQEASWVGLGWTLNVGAITRQINQYPDDAFGEIQSVNMKDLTGVRGWDANVLGYGHVGWNTMQGGYGAIGFGSLLSTQWGRSGWTVDAGGPSVGSNGVGLNGGEVVNNALTYLGGPPSWAMAAMSIAGMAAVNMSMGAQIPSAPSVATNMGYFQYSERTKSHFLGLEKDYWIWLDQTRNEQMYGVSFLQESTPTVLNGYLLSSYSFPDAYGCEYKFLNNYSFSVNGTGVGQPVSYYNSNNTGAASDIGYYIPSSKNFASAKSAATLATDNFSVNAPGISGSIEPYRFDIGSVSMPLSMYPTHNRFVPVPFAGYKVPFIYKGSLSSNYMYQNGNATAPVFGFNQSCQVTDATDVSGNYVDNVQVTMTDNSFGSNRMRTDVAQSHKVPQSGSILWMANKEIAANSGTFANGFMDYFSTQGSAPYNRAAFRNGYSFGNPQNFYCYSSTFTTDGVLSLMKNDTYYFSGVTTATLSANVYNSLTDMQNIVNGTPLTPQTVSISSVDPSTGKVTVQVPSSWSTYAGKYFSFTVTTTGSPKSPNSYGGFSITGENGMTYHFALPVYDYNFYAYMENVNDVTKNFSINRVAPFANTWLLTGVTGPDFVDRNLNGVIDSGDWGYWVKFNYAKVSDNYKWRIPYSTGTTNSTISKTIDPTGSVQQYAQGNKQLYYLNSIETRSHKAIFIKDTRLDNNDASGQTGQTYRLAEIALLRQEDYQTLLTSTGTAPLPDDSGVITTSWNIQQFFSSYSLTNPIYTSAGAFLKAHALKRVKFAHSYDLCPGALNSTGVDSNGNQSKGKLTLTRVALVGQNDQKVVPDFKFEYGDDPTFTTPLYYNPSYSSNAWDAYGVYSSQGTSINTTHAPSAIESDAFAWSLSKITTPEGATACVTYERDRYNSVSGLPLTQPPVINWSSSYTGLPFNGINTVTVTNVAGVHVGDWVNVTGSLSYQCQSTNNTYNVTAPISGTNQILYINGNSVQLSQNIGMNSNCSSGNSTTISYSGTFQKIQPYLFGDGLRVGSITLNDNGQTYKTRYLYTNSDGSPSGVIAQEPPYARTATFDFGQIPNYPVTPVMYAQVSVLSGTLSTDADYVSREVYQFETPNTDMYILNADSIQENQLYPNLPTGTFTNVANIKKEITDYSQKTGSLKSKIIYDANNNVASSTTLSYTSQLNNSGGAYNYQGIYTEGTLMFDHMLLLPAVCGNINNPYFRMTRSTIIHYPYTLQSVVKTDANGLTSRIDNLAWDFYSGQVVEKNFTSPLGLVNKSVVIPAYGFSSSSQSNPTPYLQMGPKAIDSTYKNMLSQLAAEYIYKTDGLENIVGLISGHATVWKNNWSNYRDYNNTSFSFGNGSDASGSNIWRKGQEYIYKGSVGDLQNDGSLKFSTASNLFDPGATSNLGWQKVTDGMQYDRYSMPVAKYNVVTQSYEAAKRDLNNRFVVASAVNANYNEIAFTGAEDGDGHFFGGEIALNVTGSSASTVVPGIYGSTCHTGAYAVKTTGKSFVYQPNAPLTSGRTYRAQVWSNSPSTAIYFVATTEQPATLVSTDQIKYPSGITWYRLVADIPSSATEIGVKSSDGTSILVDDFRFQPRESSMTTSVYDQSTGYLTYTIGDDNLYTRYYYDNRGIIMQTFAESIKYQGERMITQRKDDYKRFHTNQ